LYFDSCFVAKYYLGEPDSDLVCDLVGRSGPVRTSAIAITELHCVFHRALREKRLSLAEVRHQAAAFDQHVSNGIWILSPVPDGLLRRTAALVLAAPADTFLCSADAIHLVTAQELGESEIWTSDRHMLAAAPFFGLRGRTL
jgi:predicted nucleic acid-binding protein